MLLRLVAIHLSIASLSLGCTSKQEKSNVESLSYRCTATKFKKGEGGIFVNLLQRASTAGGAGAGQLAEMAQIKLTRIGQTGDIIWPIPSSELVPTRASMIAAPQGKYKIAQIMLINKGAKHVLEPTTELQSTIFMVHANCVSNLGEWAVDLKPDLKLRLDPKMTQPSFRMAAQRAGADAASVLDAYKPDEFPDIAVDDDALLTTLAKVKRSRMISMHYRLDVGRSPALAKKLMPAVKARDASIRACYTKRLDAQPKLRGSLVMKFNWMKPTGKIQDVKLAGGDLKDAQLASCVSEELRQIVLATSTTAAGIIKFVFDAKEGAQQQVATLPQVDDHQ